MRASGFLIFLLLVPSALADESLWNTLATQPNLAVVLRHANAQGNDGTAWDETGNCRGERMLTDEGKALAQKIGAAFRTRSIAPTVLSSPQCRARHTAEIAFGPYTTDAALRESGSGSSSQMQVFTDKAQALLRQHRGAKPVVLVNHKPNIEALTLETVETGELIVGKIKDNGEVDVLGKIRVSAE